MFLCPHRLATVSGGHGSVVVNPHASPAIPRRPDPDIKFLETDVLRPSEDVAHQRQHARIEDAAVNLLRNKTPFRSQLFSCICPEPVLAK